MLNSETIWKKAMTKKTRRRYTAEFKAAAVARLDEPGQTLSSVAQALGVAATQVKTWRLEQQAAGSAEAVARRRAEATALQQLRRDNKRFHDWQAGDQTRAAESRAEADLVDQVRGVFQHSGQRYGAPRIHAELQAQGVHIARKRG